MKEKADTEKKLDATQVFTNLMKRITAAPDPDSVTLNIDEAVVYTQINRQLLAQRRYRGDGPVFIKPSPKTVLYRKGDIDEWLNGNLRHTTAVAA